MHFQKYCRHASILEYLELAGGGERFKDSAAAFRREASLGSQATAAAGKKPSALARKWTTLLKLQAKVLELETQLSQTRNGGAGQSSSVVTRADFRPSQGDETRLRMHRRPITGIALHPSAPLAITSSEDSTAAVRPPTLLNRTPVVRATPQ